MICRVFILLCIFCFSIGSLNANEKGKTITFAPGGLHMMIFGLKQPLKKKQIVPLALMTKDGQQIKFDAHVVSPNQHRHH